MLDSEEELDILENDFISGISLNRSFSDMSRPVRELIHEAIERGHGFCSRGNSSSSLSNNNRDDDDLIDDSMSDTCDDKPISTLIDLSAHKVARHYPCEVLEFHDPPLDEALLKKVASWAFPQDEPQIKAFATLCDRQQAWTKGLSMLKEGRIREMWQVGFMATAYLTKFWSCPTVKSTLNTPANKEEGEGGETKQQQAEQNTDIRVSLTFERQKIISSTCSECKGSIWCPHVIAAVVYRIRNAFEIRVHAPMTETLSTLDRNQLQKLIQYAVQDDPAGILGKVFKNLDAIRDNTSEISVTEGAPDPTFGGFQGPKTQWQLSLDTVEKLLVNDLNQLCSGRSSFVISYPGGKDYYPDTYDMQKKFNSKMYHYIMRVRNLVQQREYRCAGEVLCMVLRNVVKRTREIPHFDCPNLWRLLHDLVRLCAMLVIYLKDIDKPTTEIVLETCRQLNRNAGHHDHNTSVSQWAEIPSLASLYKDHPLMEKHEKDGDLFLEPLAASLAPPQPSSLRDLLEGTTPPLDSGYEEDLLLMLARMEAMFHLDMSETLLRNVNTMGIIVLHKLVTYAIHDSVLGQRPHSAMIQNCLRNMKLDHFLNHSGSDPDQADSLQIDEPAPQTGKRKGRSGRKGGKGKHPYKRLKRANSEEEMHLKHMTKGQLTYALLHSLVLVFRTQKLSASRLASHFKKLHFIQKHQPETKVLAGYCLLALELSRHRTVFPRSEITETEHEWILKQEVCVCDFLKQNVSETLVSAGLYLDTLSNPNALEFYDGAYPLVLLEILCTLCTTGDEYSMPSVSSIIPKMLSVCANVLQDISHALDVYTLPTSSAFDIFWDVFASERPHYRQRDFTLRKLHFVAETYLSKVNIEDKEQKAALRKVLDQFCTVEAPLLLRLLTRELKGQLARFEKDPILLEAVLCFSLHAFKFTKRITLPSSSEPWRLNRDFVFSLAKKLGLSSLKLFLGRWEDTLCSSDMRELLMLFQEELQSGKSLPSEVQDLVLQCLDGRMMHHEGLADLLDFFRPGDGNYKKALAKVRENFRNFHMNALFEFARYHHQHANDKPSKRTRSSSSSGSRPSSPTAVPVTERRGRSKTKKEAKQTAVSNASATATAQVTEAVVTKIADNTAMNEDTFDLVEKALQKLEDLPANLLKLEHIDWMFVTCCGSLGPARDISRSPIFNKMVTAITLYAKHCPEVIVRILQNMEKVSNLMKHAGEPLASLLVGAYKEHFDRRFSDCGHGAYAVVINEMLRARLECKQYIKQGDSHFDQEVVSCVRRKHGTKKKLMKMLSAEFKLKAS